MLSSPTLQSCSKVDLSGGPEESKVSQGDRKPTYGWGDEGGIGLTKNLQVQFGSLVGFVEIEKWALFSEWGMAQHVYFDEKGVAYAVELEDTMPGQASGASYGWPSWNSWQELRQEFMAGEADNSESFSPGWPVKSVGYNTYVEGFSISFGRLQEKRLVYF